MTCFSLSTARYDPNQEKGASPTHSQLCMEDQNQEQTKQNKQVISSFKMTKNSIPTHQISILIKLQE